jgi:ATP-dependent exoDNAse (exonuclease V) beta subunit
MNSDADIRRQAERDLSRCYLLDAGAGTGKTTVLISRILAALSAGKSELERIVAITFTEKAAGELKIRLRSELERALQSCTPDEGARFRQAVADIERAQVTTIHSFCAALLHERPVEAGVKPDFEVLDELGADLLFERIWQEWLAGEMDQRSPALAGVLRSGIGLDALHPAAKFLLEHRDLLDTTPGPITASGEDLWKGFGAALQQLTPLQSHCENREDRAYQAIESLRLDLSAAAALPADQRLDPLLSRLKIRTNVGDQKNWKSKEPLEQTRAILAKLQAESESFRSIRSHNQTVEILGWLQGFVQRYEQAKREAGCLDFFDLLFQCRNLLKHNRRIRRYFQERFDYVLVDEFQDTDPLQIEIVFFLSENWPRAEDWTEVELRPGKLFLVGDPKQSIYSFRRADIEAYHQAKETIAKQGVTLPLSLNFRSRPPVIDWVNGLFSTLIQPPEKGYFQPSYQPITASRNDGPRVSLVALPLAPQISLGDGKAADVRAAEARTVAAFLKRIVSDGWTTAAPASGKERVLSFGDIAILFRTKEAIDRYEEEFRDFDIPYRVSGGRRYYSRLEMNALIALLSCLDNPRDEVAVVAALRSPFFAVSDEDLFLHAQAGHGFDYTDIRNFSEPRKPRKTDTPELIRVAFAFLNQFHHQRNDLPLPLFLLRLYEKSRILPLFYLKPQGDQKVANLLKMVEIARSLEARGVTTLRAFVRYLKRMDAAEAEEGESPLVEESEDAVRFMTIHKSKGLEFPLVILGDVVYRSRGRSRQALFNRAAARIELRIGPQDKALATLGWEQAKEEQDLRETAESLRLLYVAVTRARDYFVLPLDPASDREKFLTPLWSDILPGEEIPWGKQILSRSGSTVAFYDSRNLNTDKEELRPFRSSVEIKTLARRLSSKREKAEISLSAYSNWENRRNDIRAKGSRGRRVVAASVMLQHEQPEPKASGRGPLFGSFVHELLRIIDIRQPGDVRKIATVLGRSYELDATAVKKGIELVEWGLNAPVLTRAARSAKLWQEVPFVYREGEDLVEGFIDLVFEEDGEYVVVDFKTDVVKNDLALEEKVRLYTPQGAIYALALEAITTKPVKEIVFLFLSAKAERAVEFDSTGKQRIKSKLQEYIQQEGASVS